MSLTDAALRNSRLTILVTAAFVLGGIMLLPSFPKQEEPSVTIRQAVVQVARPGNDAQRMTDLVAKPLAERIRALDGIKRVESVTQEGVALLTVTAQDTVPDPAALWLRLRARVSDAARDLPPDIIGPIVNDDYGRVAVASFALHGPSATPELLRIAATRLRQQLYAQPGVAAVTTHGVIDEHVSVRVDAERLAIMGLTLPAVQSAIARFHARPDPAWTTQAGFIVRLAPDGEVADAEALGRMPLALPSGETMPLASVATLRRAMVEEPSAVARYQGQLAAVLAVSVRDDVDVVAFGARLRQHLPHLAATLPSGLHLTQVTDQASVVSQEIGAVSRTFLETVAVVMAVVVVFLGLRTGWIVGCIVPVAVLTTLVAMRVLDIGINSVSIAALIISLGLLVDNGIVIAEDIQRRLADGEERGAACRAAGSALAVPLATSSLITALAFLPLLLSQTSTGEYARGLGIVLALTLGTSWVAGLTLIPLLCFWFARARREESIEGRWTRWLRRVLEKILRHRWWFLAGMAELLLTALALLQLVPQTFMPPSPRPQLQITLEGQAGHSVQQTIANVELAGAWLANRATNPFVRDHTAFIGEGGPRIILSLNPPQPAPERAYVIVNLEPDSDIAAVRNQIERGLVGLLPETRVLVQRFSYGQNAPGTLSVRLTGETRSSVTNAGRDVYRIFAEAGLRDLVDDLPVRTSRLRVTIDDERAARLGVDRATIHSALATRGDGVIAGAISTQDGVIPIRLADQQRGGADLSRLPVTAGVMLSHVATIDWEGVATSDRLRDLRPVVTISGCEPDSAATTVLERLRHDLDRISIAHGVAWEVGGEIEEAHDANDALLTWMPLTGFLFIAVFLWQFNSWRKLILIVIGIPFTLIGVALGMLALGAPFDFMAGLGLLALAGIIVNNAVLLLEQIDVELAAGTPPSTAIINACLRRVRPILMTKLTCILGLIPLMLFGGPLWYSMAVVIAGGLALGTLVTIGLIPVCYAILFRVPKP